MKTGYKSGESIFFNLVRVTKLVKAMEGSHLKPRRALILV